MHSVITIFFLFQKNNMEEVCRKFPFLAENIFENVYDNPGHHLVCPYSRNLIFGTGVGMNYQSFNLYELHGTYVLDVLCRQQIKLFQVASTSEFH